ncbi:Basic leucine zipper 43 [Camellia lanceoleosa]|uniref:Basic leucine zipper 43 n=1 Tax=Camellia lanceoleosa TaxID=1840588 RepID=A0ACC0I7N3_9ERIC|nr:Basic leucine zipper 43 [Camellia lanceoleosa]
MPPSEINPQDSIPLVCSTEINSSLFQNNIPPSFQFNGFHSTFPNSHPYHLLHEFPPQSSCLSTNSTSDEAEDYQLSIIVDERKKRRMISNRESARRSRMRRQNHLGELQSRVILLWTENQNLTEENSKLREEVSDLRKMITELGIGSTYNGVCDLEEFICNTAHLRAESSNQSISTTTTSTNLLH